MQRLSNSVACSNQISPPRSWQESNALHVLQLEGWLGNDVDPTSPHRWWFCSWKFEHYLWLEYYCHENQSINPTAITKSNTFTSSSCYLRLYNLTPLPGANVKTARFSLLTFPPTATAVIFQVAGWYAPRPASSASIDLVNLPGRLREMPLTAVIFNRFTCTFRYSLEVQLQRQWSNKKHLEKLDMIQVHQHPTTHTPNEMEPDVRH